MKRTTLLYSTLLVASALASSCGTPKIIEKQASTANLPQAYAQADSMRNIADLHWNKYFNDPHLVQLIDTALLHNQELNVMLQEIAISSNEVLARKGEYLPFVGVRGGAGVEKRSENTPLGALEREVEIRHGKENPEPMPDFGAALFANWEIDIWHKLHNATKAAQLRFLSSVEGKNFMVTNLVAEIANSYYELLALDQQRIILQQNIALQENALTTAKVQKLATRVTELAVKKFEAELLKTQSLQFEIDQHIVETENKLNYLAGRFPQHIERTTAEFDENTLAALDAGLPAQLLENRPDVRQAELSMAAADLDVKVAKARFYPSLGISASIGYQAFNPAYLLKTPQSLVYSLAGDLMAPLVNKKAIQADYLTANSKQIQSVFEYEQTVLNAYVEVANQLSKYHNAVEGTRYKNRQVNVLNESIQIANDLFSAAHADYMEVLTTQRDVLESKFELIESQKSQYNALVDLYRSLGGGWQ